MSDANLLKPEERFIALFIGRSGSGKKAAACTLPHPIKYFDFDNRIRGLLGCSWVDRKGIDYSYYPPLTGNVFGQLNKDLEVMKIQASMNQLPYKTIVLGSLTGESLAFLNDATIMTHNANKGKTIGALNMPGPEDYGFQSIAMHQVLAFFRSLPSVNIVISAHIIARFAQVPGPDGKINPYSDKVEVGERLSLTDKLSESLPAFFDNIFKFSKVENGNKTMHFVKFRGDLPRTTFANLPDGEIDVTGKNFWDYLKTKGVVDAGN